MNSQVAILIVEAMSFYLIVLAVHSLRRRFGLAPFYALLGGVTAVMSWVTDAGVAVKVAGITFMVGSTVFYTSLLLGVFVVYVFDGPRATRIAISTVAGVSAMVPLIAVLLHLQTRISGHTPLTYVPMPSLRINTASVLATIADLVFLAVAWESLGTPRLHVPLWLRAFLTLLGVMWLDVFLFATGAFAGSPEYIQIMAGTLLSRLLISVFAYPLLYLYLSWQNKQEGIEIANRPVLAILREVSAIRLELDLAQQEIERRKRAEWEKEVVIQDLQQALSEVRTLRGLIPICASCKKIRDDAGYWRQIEEYISAHSAARFSHGICPECVSQLYPEFMSEAEE